MSRLDALEVDPRCAQGRRAVRERVRGLLDGAPAAQVNQALMELGALVCTPRKPRCEACPWSSACAGRARGIERSLPLRPSRRPPRPIRAVAALLRRADGRLLMGRRPPGLLGGLWEPIGGDWPDALGPAQAVRVACRARAGRDVRVTACAGEVVHVFSHRRLRLSVWDVVEVGSGGAEPAQRYPELRWVDPERPEVALSTLARKTVALVDQPGLPLAADAPDGQPRE